MSLKGVELQIAIPKTFDAGKTVEQHQQHVIHQQLHANEALKKEVERKALTVNDTEKVDKVKDENQHHEHDEESSSNNKQRKSSKQSRAHHPFKGNIIDYSG
ncbi:RNA polymerase subunit sigma [Ureibacillus composti]|nr:RNA polymerase subunit sigma [Ureibacillus composti]